MTQGSKFLSCDWGTSSFRVHLLEGEEVLAEFRSADGCRSIYDRAREIGADSIEVRARVYGEFLRDVLKNRGDKGMKLDEPVPLVISGMASSTIGWKEIPYASVPLHLDGSNLSFARIDWEKPSIVSDTYLISGVATQDEIMRGEETEALGLLSQEGMEEECLLVLPGTHSKHLLVRENQIVDFWTYMTGELFDALSGHTVLKATVDLSSLANASDTHFDAFDAGVRLSDERGLGRSLFRTRTRSILKSRPNSENTWFLSGLLIGAELSDMIRDRSNLPILLGGANTLRRLYARAMRTLSSVSARVPEWRELPSERVDRAVSLGQRLFLERRLR